MIAGQTSPWYGERISSPPERSLPALPGGKSHSSHGIPKWENQQQGKVQASPTILSRASQVVSGVAVSGFEAYKSDKNHFRGLGQANLQGPFQAKPFQDSVILQKRLLCTDQSILCKKQRSLMKGTSFKAGEIFPCSPFLPPQQFYIKPVVVHLRQRFVSLLLEGWRKKAVRTW